MDRVIHIPGVAETKKNVGIKTVRTEVLIMLFIVSFRENGDV